MRAGEATLCRRERALRGDGPDDRERELRPAAPDQNEIGEDSHGLALGTDADYAAKERGVGRELGKGSFLNETTFAFEPSPSPIV